MRSPGDARLATIVGADEARGRELEFTLDGRPHRAIVSERIALSDHLRACGSPVNVGCETGACNSCLVRLDGELVPSCLLFAVQVAGCEVTTAQGLWTEHGLTAAQLALSDRSGLQCGFCSPAFALCLDTADSKDTAPVELLAPILCRCTGYRGQVRALESLQIGAAEASIRRDVRRREDTRLLRGQAWFTTNLQLAGQLHLRVVRSPHPGARVLGIDRASALTKPGVVAVITAADLPPGVRHPHPDLEAQAQETTEPTLAIDHVRYVGQPVAAVVAETAEDAADAAAALRIDYATLPAAAGTARLDDAWVGTQRVGRYEPGPDDVVVRGRFEIARQTGMPLEPRALAAAWDPETETLTVWGVCKHPGANRDRLARSLGLDPGRVRMPSGDVGGAFGVRGEFYPEDLLVPFAAMTLGRPVRWVERREEHLVAANHSREQVWEVELAAHRDGVLAGARVEIVSDGGAYLRPLTRLVPYLGSAMFPGPYRLPALEASVRTRFTNKTPVGTYRAPGRFEANFVRERALDLLSARLGMDPAELRRRNLIGEAEMPYDVGTTNEGPVRYDAGDFAGAYERALAAAQAWDAGAAPGVLVGTAVAPFVEKAGIGPVETAQVVLTPEPRLRVHAASSPSGQGHETLFLSIVREVLDVPADRIDVVCGCDPEVAAGPGTFASRGAMATGSAVYLAARQLRDRLFALVVARTGFAQDMVDMRGGMLCAGSFQLDLAELAVELAPELRTASGSFDCDRHSYPFGAVACQVEVDPELLTVRVRRLHVFCDAGRVLDRDSVEGQLVGAAVQGLGGALGEALPYDADGRPLVLRLDDYPLPRANDVPAVEVTLLEPAPTSSNPLGVKGVGEAGIAAIGGVVASAVCAAMPVLTGRLDRLPITPSALHRLLATADRDQSHEEATT
jgi:aerobic carbon-monoxide dehydrogenase large subunit